MIGDRWQRGWRKGIAATASIAAVVAVILGSSGCPSNRVSQSDRDGTSGLVTRAHAFRALVEEGEYEAAREFMSENARRWWETRDGEGRAWQIGPESRGPWADWDDHFRARKDIVEWKEGPRSATAVIRETNDYFRMLERGWVTNEVTYYFDESGTIDGLLIRAVGDRPEGRTDEFLAWARTHDAAELEALMPGGEIDPSADHPERFRRLLNRWRRATGLEPIE